ncbi:hypothetical protein PR003_g34079, partial [Phytophthora rubi]
MERRINEVTQLYEDQDPPCVEKEEYGWPTRVLRRSSTPTTSILRRESSTLTTSRPLAAWSAPSARVVFVSLSRPKSSFQLQAPQVQLPASGAPVHSVTALVADAHTLQRENQELRTQYELVSVHNAGLATHASVLHDRNLAILHRAREGYRAGMIRLEQALLSRERVERDYADLEGRVADFRARA